MALKVGLRSFVKSEPRENKLTEDYLDALLR